MTEKNLETFRENYLTTFPKFWPVASFWPQNEPILTIFTKNDLFDKIDPINDTFEQFYVHKHE